MSKFIIPYDETNSTNPYLLNKNADGLILHEGNKLTAEYIWSKKQKDRDDLVEYVFNYYREKGFPFKREDEEDLRNTYDKIIKRQVDDLINENGEIVNSNSYGGNIIKHFMGELFYSTKGSSKSKSCLDVFNDDGLFKEVLRNRMGYRISKEDGTERPYVFSISDDMIIQGMRSSGVGFSTSQFKIMVAKYIYKNFGGPKVIDYSGGWGARAIAAGSLGFKYYGIDPLTYNKCNEMMKFFDIKGNVFNGGSEEEGSYINIPNDCDLAFSSPPYFNLEVYSDDVGQSYNKFNDYEKWLDNYWSGTIENCFNHIRSGGKFILCAVETVGKLNIGKDMVSRCEKRFKLNSVLNIKVHKGHLSGKKKSGIISKTTEAFYIFDKI
jgi:hypothetical protein